MAPTRFCGETVQSELEAILASGHRQVAARIALYCSELVEAAREDERQQLRDRQLAAGAGGQTGDGTGLRPSPEAAQKSAEAAQKLAQQPTLDQFHTDRATDRDCVWILRTAFSIRNKAVPIQIQMETHLQAIRWQVIQRGKDEALVDVSWEAKGLLSSTWLQKAYKDTEATGEFRGTLNSTAPAHTRGRYVSHDAGQRCIKSRTGSTGFGFRSVCSEAELAKDKARAVQVFKSGNLTQQIARWLPPVKLVAFRRISPCCRQVVSDLLASDEALRNEVQAALQEVLHQKDNRVWVGIRVRNHSADPGSFAVDRRQITLANPSSSTASASSTSFVFNRVFDHRANQMDVWSSIQAPLMRCVLRREHACLFAYGQTGSGKTYTMFGDPASPSESGLAFRITDSLKQLLQSATCVEDRPSLEFSFLEVYNERVHDLLANSKVCVLAGEREELAPGSTYHAAKLGDEHVIVRGLTRRTCGVHDITEK
ncbi:KIN14D, partial [Symbiodinium necroappetens]